MARRRSRRSSRSSRRSSPACKSFCGRATRTPQRDVILEIRGAEGGQEANLWAADLMRMYMKYAELKGWKVEVLNTSETELGRHQGSDLRAPRARGLLAHEVGRRRPSRAARARNRGAGPHSHVGRDGQRAAQGRRSRRADPRRRAARRRVSRGRPRWPGGQHDRLGRADDPPADGAGRAPARTSARSSRTRPGRWTCCGRGCSSWSCASSRRKSAARGACRSARASAAARSARTTSARTG